MKEITTKPIVPKGRYAMQAVHKSQVVRLQSLSQESDRSSRSRKLVSNSLTNKEWQPLMKERKEYYIEQDKNGHVSNSGAKPKAITKSVSASKKSFPMTEVTFQKS